MGNLETVRRNWWCRVIVYNIEKFIINEMLRPYQNLIISCKNVSNDTEYKKRVKDCEKELKKNPMLIFSVLDNNKEARTLVFNRLKELDIQFYKWLDCPFIDEFEQRIFCNGIGMKSKFGASK